MNTSVDNLEIEILVMGHPTQNVQYAMENAQSLEEQRLEFAV